MASLGDDDIPACMRAIPEFQAYQSPGFGGEHPLSYIYIDTMLMMKT